MPHPFPEWLTCHVTPVRRHSLRIFSEVPNSRPAVEGRIHQICRDHYVAPDIVAQRLIDLGAPQSAALLREHFPKGKRARSGDLGEIIASEIAEHHLNYTVPVRRLRYKEAREMALRGDDVLGYQSLPNGTLKFLKGESKSRKILSDAVVTQAATALDKDRGHPNRLSMIFVATRLREKNENQIASAMEKAVLDSFKHSVVEQMLCAISGNAPGGYLSTHINAHRKARTRHAIGLRIPALKLRGEPISPFIARQPLSK